MTTFVTVSVPVAGGSVSVRRRRGSSPTLVFLHYWGGSAATWDQVIEHLRGQDAVAYDQRGWGSAASLSGPYSLQQMAADVDAIAAREGLKHVVLVGHSMGGKVAQIVAGRRPSYLSGLVLVAPAPPRPPAHITTEYQQQLAHAYDTSESAAISLDNVLTRRALSDELRQQVLHDSLDSAPAARTVWPLEGIAADISESARAIAVPALVLVGQHDKVEAPAVQQELTLPALPRARMVTLPNVGHLLPLEAPVEVAREIRGFLDQPRPTERALRRPASLCNSARPRTSTPCDGDTSPRVPAGSFAPVSARSGELMTRFTSFASHGTGNKSSGRRAFHGFGAPISG